MSLNSIDGYTAVRGVHEPGEADGPIAKRPCAWSNCAALRTTSNGRLDRSAMSSIDWAPSEKFSTHSMAIFSVAMSLLPPIRTVKPTLSELRFAFWNRVAVGRVGFDNIYRFDDEVIGL